MVNPPQQTPSWPIQAIGIKIEVHVLYQALEAREKITSIANFDIKISRMHIWLDSVHVSWQQC